MRMAKTPTLLFYGGNRQTDRFRAPRSRGTRPELPVLADWMGVGRAARGVRFLEIEGPRRFSLDASRDPLVESSNSNLVRILSRVAEGRALRRHSNRSTIAVDAGANSCPA